MLMASHTLLELLLELLACVGPFSVGGPAGQEARERDRTGPLTLANPGILNLEVWHLRKPLLHGLGKLQISDDKSYSPGNDAPENEAENRYPK